MLPKITVASSAGGISPPDAFVPDPSGAVSRTVFETNEYPTLKIYIREFSFRPDRQARTITLPSAAVIQISGEHTDVRIAKERVALVWDAQKAVPAHTQIEVENGGTRPVVMRALIVEPK